MGLFVNTPTTLNVSSLAFPAFATTGAAVGGDVVDPVDTYVPPYIQPSSFGDLGKPISAAFGRSHTRGAFGNKSRRAGSKAPDQLPEDRFLKWASDKWNKLTQSKFAQKIKKLLWDPPDMSRSAYQQSLVDGMERFPMAGLTCHKSGTVRTQAIVDEVKRFVKKEWTESGEPMIAEFGPGDGHLQEIVFQQTGVRVIGFDLFDGDNINGIYRKRVDFTDMKDVRSNTYPVAISSFALEYEGLPAFREACRVMTQGGHLIALVHHRGSAIVHGAEGPSEWKIALYKFLVGFKPMRFITPRLIINGLSISIRTDIDFQDKIFRSEEHLRDVFQRAGLVVEKINPVFDGIGPVSSKSLHDLGWLVVARKK